MGSTWPPFRAGQARGQGIHHAPPCLRRSSGFSVTQFDGVDLFIEFEVKMNGKEPDPVAFIESSSRSRALTYNHSPLSR